MRVLCVCSVFFYAFISFFPLVCAFFILFLCTFMHLYACVYKIGREERRESNGFLCIYTAYTNPVFSCFYNCCCRHRHLSHRCASIISRRVFFLLSFRFFVRVYVIFARSNLFFFRCPDPYIFVRMQLIFGWLILFIVAHTDQTNNNNAHTVILTFGIFGTVCFAFLSRPLKERTSFHLDEWQSIKKKKEKLKIEHTCKNETHAKRQGINVKTATYQRQTKEMIKSKSF